MFEHQEKLLDLKVTPIVVAGLVGLGTAYLFKHNRSSIQKYLTNKGFYLMDKGLDLYLDCRNLYYNWRYHCHYGQMHNQNQPLEKPKLVKVTNVNIRLIQPDNVIEKRCFKINKEFRPESKIDLELLGLDEIEFPTLYNCTETRRHDIISNNDEVKSLSDLAIDSDDETDSNSNADTNCSDSVVRSISESPRPLIVYLDLFYQFQDRDYLVSQVLDHPGELSFIFKFTGNLMPVSFSKAKLTTNSEIYQEILDENQENSWLLERIRAYLGPNGDFHETTAQMKLQDLYFPEIRNAEIISLELETDLGDLVKLEKEDLIAPKIKDLL